MDDVIEIIIEVLGIAGTLITSNKTPSWLRKLLLIALVTLLVIVIVALTCVALRPGSLPLRILAAFGAIALTVAGGIGLHYLLEKSQNHT